MLEEEFKYYINHQTELLKKYLDKFIVIKGEEVIGVYDTATEANEKTVKDHERGTFLIQHCLPGTESYTNTFHSRAIIRK